MTRWFALVALAACSKPAPAATDAAPPPLTSASAAPSVRAPSAAPAGARTFPDGATFADLVKAVRDDPATKPGRGCLLSADGPLTLEAPTALGRTKIPDPPADLDATLGAPRHGGVRLWASWGETDGGELLDLIALTPVSKAVKSSLAAVLAVTDKGTYFLAVGLPSDGHVASESDVERVKSEVVPKARAWVITAEAGVPLAKLREPLGWIKETTGTVVLATPAPSVLGPKRRLSRYDAKVPAGQPDACDREMQGGVAGSAAGDFGMSQFARVTTVFEAIAEKCGKDLAPGAGGAIHVMTRVGKDGAIGKACAETDDTSDAALRTCAMTAVRATKLEPPATPGIVPFGTALLFFGKPVAPLCP
jgi:hypothetical protein